MRTEFAEHILQPYHDIIRDCILQGWQEWQRLQIENPQQTKALKPRTRAGYVNDQIQRNAKKQFGELQDANVIVREQNQLFMIEFGGTISIRFKKLDRTGKPRNIRTRQQKKFYYQQKSLPGFADLRLTVGYMLDVTESEIEDIRVCYTLGGSVRWYYSILQRDSMRMDDMFGEPEEIPLTTTVRPKKANISQKSAKGQ